MKATHYTNLRDDTEYHLSIGYYTVQLLPDMPTKVVLRDTRTHEAGAFDKQAVTNVLAQALDTFFAEAF